MKGYLSLDEMIAIAENKIKGSIFEILGTEKFLQKVLDNAEITPVYRFKGYIVTQAKVDNNFYGKMTIFRISDTLMVTFAMTIHYL